MMAMAYTVSNVTGVLGERWSFLPRYLYLTRSYVEWLGLERVLHFVPSNRGYVGMGMGGTLPFRPDPIRDGVVFEGRPYEREPDGLAYRWMGYDQDEREERLTR